MTDRCWLRRRTSRVLIHRHRTFIMMDPTFFATPEEFRAWLEEHHEREPELWVGFYKKATGIPSITWPQSVDEALCFGWIDGIRRSLGEKSYMIRFTPRKPSSTWSAVNVSRMEVLQREGRVRPAGMRAFTRRKPASTGIYSYEQRKSAALDPEMEAAFRADAPAWEYFQARPAGYRQTATWWVISAKRPETRWRRLARLIENSRALQDLSEFTRPGEETRG